MFSVEPSHSPSGIFEPLGSDPQRHDHRALLELDPVDHHHRQAQIGELAGHQLAQRLRVRSMNVRYTADFDVERPLASTSSPTGSWVRL